MGETIDPPPLVARSTFARARLTLGLIFMGLARKKITEGFLLMTWGPRLPDSSGQKALDALCES